MKQTAIVFFLYLTGCLALFPTSAFAQQPLHLGFEKKSVEGAARPWGWSFYTYIPEGDLEMEMDSIFRRSGDFSLRFTGKGEYETEAPYSVAYWINPRSLVGKKIQLEGWVSTENLNGAARISLAFHGQDGYYDTVDGPELSGDNDWRFSSLEAEVDSSVYSIYVRVDILGEGKAWFDDLALKVDGERLETVSVAPKFSAAQFNWIEQNTTAFKRVVPSRPEDSEDFSDLEAFGRQAGDARVIALGESTHGTREFFTLKHRLLQYAVAELGVSIFAIEANQLLVERINDYVLHGHGSAKEGIKVMFAVWNTKEVLDLIEWMRAYNEKNPERKVEFAGFDMQDPRLPIDSLSKFLADFDPDLQALADSLVYNYRQAWAEQYYPMANDSVRRRWKENAVLVDSLVSVSRQEWLSRCRTKEQRTRVEWAVQNARVIRQAAVAAYTQDLVDRDRAMAENVSWILTMRPPGTRMVVWAHDSHISRGTSPDPMYNYFGGGSMGSHLADQYGDAYKAFGLVTYDGQYRATISFSDHKMAPVDAFPAPEGALEEALHRIARRDHTPNLLLNLQPTRDQKDKEWLFLPRPVRFVGYAASDFSYEALISIPHQFDGLFFIDRTTASVPE